MKPPHLEFCGTCSFHDPAPAPGKNGLGEEVTVGFCMRYPPQITVQGASSYPTVGSETNWCGEYVVSPATIEQRATPTRKRKP